ncbi:hypothetical protein [Cohnella panacarvi]|uniref:hypothetical protein n=1 Tax=Cohnella panacarvi TaxID=400776 RepID=UPI0004B06421|nr:hypothetical protein [Cohnella panacarvi]
MFKKSLSVLSVTIVSAAILIPTISVQAKEKDPNVVFKSEKFGSTVVSFLNDGRIKGVPHPEKLSKEDRKKILKQLNFKDKDIEEYPDDFEFVLLQEGGRKVEVTVGDYQHTVTHEDGTTEIINDSLVASTPTTEGLPKSNGEVNVLSMGTASDGKWSGAGVLTYLGTTTTEYKYKYRTTFNWSSKPNYVYVDDIAISWNDTSVPVGTSGYDYRRYEDGGYYSHTSRMSLTQVIPAGVSAEIDLASQEGNHYGYLEREVRIAKTRQGLTEVFGSAYGHSHLPSWMGGIGVSIGWASIDLSGTGDQWTWTSTFTVGSTS